MSLTSFLAICHIISSALHSVDRRDQVALDSIVGPAISDTAISSWNAIWHPSDTIPSGASQLWYVREKGIEFFQNHPSDSRRWRWFIVTTNNTPEKMEATELMLWKTKGDTAVVRPKTNTAGRARWGQIYPMLRQQFLASTEVNQDDKQKFLYDEIRAGITQMMLEKRGGMSVDPRPWRRRIIEYARLASMPEPYTARNLANYLWSFSELKMSRAATKEFLVWMKTSGNSELAAYGRGKERLLALGDRPLEMRLVTMDGNIFDLSKFRGKVVLIDFWDTACSACIGGFAGLKRVYERHHHLGFEVFSVSLDPDSKKERVDAILTQHNLPWSQVFTGKDGAESNPYVKKYQIYGLPEMFLVDQRGRLVQNGAITEDELEQAVGRLLNELRHTDER